MARILVADDNRHIRDGVGRLGRLGRHDVDSVATFTAAIDMFMYMVEQGRGYDLVISDVDMPDGTGMELHECVSKTVPDCHFVLMSGDPYELRRREYAEANGIQLFAKGSEGLRGFLIALKDQDQDLGHLIERTR